MRSVAEGLIVRLLATAYVEGAGVLDDEAEASALGARGRERAENLLNIDAFLHQVLGVRPRPDGTSGFPLRPDWLS